MCCHRCRLLGLNANPMRSCTITSTEVRTATLQPHFSTVVLFQRQKLRLMRHRALPCTVFRKREAGHLGSAGRCWEVLEGAEAQGGRKRLGFTAEGLS